MKGGRGALAATQVPHRRGIVGAAGLRAGPMTSFCMADRLAVFGP
jgi:hypothetical protein